MFKIKSWLNLPALILSLVFLSTKVAQASLLGDYVASPKPKKVEQRRTVGSGSRSDCESSMPKNSVTLLVPEAKVVHQTSLNRPSFFLYSKVASSVAFKFTLVNPQVAEPIVEKTLSVPRSGIKQIQLPNSTRLEEGAVYLWYVSIPCSNDPNNYQEILGAAVERVPVSPKVVTQLQKAETVSETAAIYASNGIWYEALDLAIQDRSNYLQQLLESAGLTNQDITNE